MPNLIDPNSTITFGHLKLKAPYSLSSPESNDYLCAFDGTDGELSKTNIGVNELKKYIRGYFKYGTGNAAENVDLGETADWAIYTYWGERNISFNIRYVNITTSDRYIAFISQ